MGTIERQLQTVRLDGERLRSLREERGLTQLYVAEVVGVTVDTVSRWENNRTASVRRENVASLARALGVEADELVRPEEGAEPGPPTPSAPAPGKPASPALGARLLLTAALLPLLAAVAAYYLSEEGPRVAARRALPSYLAPGSAAPVGVEVRSEESRPLSVVVSETLPEGWTLEGSFPPPDRGPSADNSFKWILALANGAGRITYVVKAPPEGREATRHLFSGELVSGEEYSARTAGGDSVDLEFVHWADSDADFRIDDAEVLRALELLDRVRGIGPDPADLRRLWGGGVYAWDPAKGGFFIPAGR